MAFQDHEYWTEQDERDADGSFERMLFGPWLPGKRPASVESRRFINREIREIRRIVFDQVSPDQYGEALIVVRQALRGYREFFLAKELQYEPLRRKMLIDGEAQ